MWNQDLATQWGISQGLLNQGEQATNGLLVQRADEAGKRSQHDLLMEYYNDVPDAATPSGIRPLNISSQNQYQQDALYEMGQPQAPVDPRIGQSYDAASNAVGNVTTPYDPNSYQAYMNPFLNDVVDATRNDIVRSYDDSRTRAREEIAANGAFGSSVLNEYYADIDEAQNRQLDSTLSNLRYQGYSDANNQALNVWQGQNANNATAASQYLNLGGAYGGFDEYSRGVDYTGQDRKLYAGDRIQQQNQALLDSYYADIDGEQAYPYTQTNYLQGVLGSYPKGSTSTTTQSGNPLQSAIGGGLLGNSIGNYWNQQNYEQGGFTQPYNSSNTYYNHTAGDTLPWLK